MPLNLEYSDLHVHQSEYQSSCATVLMLDCSHSMILYGEDRFTPAKKVALALAHLIRTQYPGDSLRCVLFHDSAEELRIVGSGASAGGSVLHQHARRPDPGAAAAEPGKERHEADHHDHRRQAVGADAGRRAHVPNAFGLDPLVISRTLEEVSRCKRQGILINTFMLASDYRPGEFRPEGDRAVPRQGLFHDAVQSGAISADGLHESQDADDSLNDEQVGGFALLIAHSYG